MLSTVAVAVIQSIYICVLLYLTGCLSVCVQTLCTNQYKRERYTWLTHAFLTLYVCMKEKRARPHAYDRVCVCAMYTTCVCALYDVCMRKSFICIWWTRCVRSVWLGQRSNSNIVEWKSSTETGTRLPSIDSTSFNTFFALVSIELNFLFHSTIACLYYPFSQ